MTAALATPPVPRTRENPRVPPAKTPEVTVIVPAYNEAASIADTLRSLLGQTVGPRKIIVVDDCSTDGTGDVARGFGGAVTVVRPPTNTGSKAGAQNHGLLSVQTEYCIAIDADTMLAPDAIERLLPAFNDPNVAAACGFVLPRFVRTVWERGRYVEYLFAFSFYKQVQEYYQKPLIASGCFSMYRTLALRAEGGWPASTLAEDMDLTWRFYGRGRAVRFVPEATCYPIEPHTFTFMARQLKRWSHGFLQNVKLHWRDLLRIPYLRTAVAVSLWDATIASLVYLVVLPALAVALLNPWILLGYFVDVPALAVPVLVGARARGEMWRAVASLPAFFVLRTVNAVFFLLAAFQELVRGRSFHVYQKGH